MKKSLVKWLTDAWYQEMYLSAGLMPFSMFYVDAIKFRRFLYRIGLKKHTRLPVPVVIIGNITVGGTGKTPLVIALSHFLLQRGYKPGVISRGYTGKHNLIPQIVAPTSDPSLVGDEALLLSKHCACPVAIGVNRVAAAKLLLAEHGCNIILSDDGLQHYALDRDIEICVIDGERRFGNGYCLPAGPLREPVERIKKVDLLVCNGGKPQEPEEFSMQCTGDRLVNLKTGENKAVGDFRGQTCHAVAAIGNPKRFFNQLEAMGLTLKKHALPDHAPLLASDLQFHDDNTIIMTEKDAVKCADFAQMNHWYFPIKAELPDDFYHQFITLLKNKHYG